MQKNMNLERQRFVKFSFGGVSLLLLPLTLTLAPPVLPVLAQPHPVQPQGNRLPSQIEQALRRDLSDRTGLPAGRFKLVQATQRTWPNGCLGLNDPQEFCTQMSVEGWQVIFAYQAQRWTYRTDMKGQQRRLEN